MFQIAEKINDQFCNYCRTWKTNDEFSIQNECKTCHANICEMSKRDCGCDECIQSLVEIAENSFGGDR